MSQATDSVLAEALSADTRAERLREIHSALGTTSPRNARQHQIGAALAGNPNTPPDVLIALFEEHYREALRNPAFPLIPLSNPDFVRSLTSRGVQRALSDAAAPVSFVQMVLVTPPTESPRPHNALDNAGLQAEARQHISLSGEVKSALWREAVYDFWREYTSRLGSEERSACAELADYGLLPAEYSMIATDFLAAEDAAEADRLLNEPRSQQIRKMMTEARNPACPPDRIRRYAADPLEWLRIAVALNPEASTEVLLILIRHRHSQNAPVYLRALARHPHADREILGYLTGFAAASATPRESYAPVLPSVCRLVARHPHADASLREALRNRAVSASPTTRSYYQNGGNSLYRFALRFFANRGWDGKVENARYNSASERLGAALLLPVEQLDALVQDGNRVVRAAAQARRRGEMFAWDVD